MENKSYVITTFIFAALQIHPGPAFSDEEKYSTKLSIYNFIPSYAKSEIDVQTAEVRYLCYEVYNGKSYTCDISSSLNGVKDKGEIESFDIDDLIPNTPKLDCTAMEGHSKEELLIYGGDFSNKDTRQPTLNSLPYLLDGKSLTGQFKKVEGKTLGDGSFSVLSYKTPAYAGIYEAETFLKVPEHPSKSWKFVFKDGNDQVRYLDRHIIGFKGFSRMAGCPDGTDTGENYIISRGDSNVRPEGNWALSGTINVAESFADVLIKYELKISYNDASLPLGGKSVHTTHRTGRDIDINTGKGEIYDCQNPVESERKYQIAFTRLYGKKHTGPKIRPKGYEFPYLACYDDKRMHIDAVSGF